MEKSVHILCMFILLTASGCSTIEGLGKDLNKVGDEIITGSEKINEALSKEKVD